MPVTSPSVIKTRICRLCAWVSCRGTWCVTGVLCPQFSSNAAATAVGALAHHGVEAVRENGLRARGLGSVKDTAWLAKTSKRSSKATMLNASRGPKARRHARTARIAAWRGPSAMEPERSTRKVTTREVVSPNSAKAGGINATVVVGPRLSRPWRCIVSKPEVGHGSCGAVFELHDEVTVEGDGVQDHCNVESPVGMVFELGCEGVMFGMEREVCVFLRTHAQHEFGRGGQGDRTSAIAASSAGVSGTSSCAREAYTPRASAVGGHRACTAVGNATGAPREGLRPREVWPRPNARGARGSLGGLRHGGVGLQGILRDGEDGLGDAVRARTEA